MVRIVFSIDSPSWKAFVANSDKGIPMFISARSTRYLLMASLCAMASCASIVDGSNQSLSVKTTLLGADLPGAQCALTNDKGTWFVTTPGTVTVHRSYDALNVKCTEAGYVPAVIASGSSTKGMAFGNLLFGGFIGAGVDVSTGAAYDYPKLITVPLVTAPAPAAPLAVPTS